MSGGAPGIPVSFFLEPVMEGKEFINPTVYGCSGSSKSSREGALSTISPAYMIAIRVENSTSKDRSLVINSLGFCHSDFSM